MYSVFVNNIEFDFEAYNEMSSMDGECFNIDASFPYGSEKQAQWDQLYEEIGRVAWVHGESFLKLSVPHLDISGLFRMKQIYYVGYEDKFVFSVRAEKSSPEETE